ncbi:MAG: antibiotic biosynthesis monooxygenase [Chloroflexota bacterium]
MHIVLVHVHVKKECVHPFIEATLENVRNSVLEAGIFRFDFYQQRDEPEKFTLVEVYYKEEDQHKHRATSHYQMWRDKVTEMMAEPRQGIRYNNLFPRDDEWKK